MFSPLHLKKRGSDGREEKLHPPRIHHKLARESARPQTTMFGFGESKNHVHACKAPPCTKHTHTHTSRHVPLHSNGYKKLGESRCGHMYDSQVLIKQRRCGIANETPSHFLVFVAPITKTHAHLHTCACGE